MRERIRDKCSVTIGRQAEIPNTRSINRIWPTVSALGSQRIWPLRTMFIAFVACDRIECAIDRSEPLAGDDSFLYETMILLNHFV